MTDVETPIEPDAIEPPDSVSFKTTDMALVIRESRPGSPISSNIDDLVAQVQELLDNNQLWDLRSAEDYSDAKKARADIRRVRKAINDAYVSIKHDYEVPLEDFHQEVKRALIPLDEADRSFKDALGNFDRKRADKRRAFLAENYEDMAGILADRVPFDKFLEVRGERAKNGDLLWLRNTTLEMAALESMGDVLRDMLGEWELIESFADSTEDADLIHSYYLQSLDVKKALTDFKATKAHEAALRAEREAEEAWMREQASMAQQDVEEDIAEPEPMPEREPVEDDAQSQWRVTAIGVFTGTDDQMDNMQDSLSGLGFFDIRIEAVDDAR